MAETLDAFLELIGLHGLEHYRKFYGIYRGEVTRTDDPEKRGRIQAHVPAALQVYAPDVWIDPAFEGAGLDRGMFWPPELGDSVRVAFERGDARRPCIYWGGWYGAPASRSGLTEVPAELGYPGDNSAPTRRGVVTRMGHSLVFDDTPAGEAVKLTWHLASSGDVARTDASATADRSQGDSAFLSFDADGVRIRNAAGSTVLLDAKNRRIYVEDENGNKVTLDKDGARIQAVRVLDLLADFVNIASGNDAHAVRGEDLLRWIATHTHPTAMGYSGPPTVPPPATILSKHVRIK
jgi:hypothetical protein